MPVYKGRTAGTWRVTVFAQGRQQESIVRGSRAEALAHEARERIALAASGPPTTRTAPSFATFCVEVYRPHAKAHLKADTWDKVRRYQVETLIVQLGPLKLTEISTSTIETYKATRGAALTRSGGRVKPTSINNELRLLRTILKWARTTGYPCATPTIKSLPTRGPSRVHAWSREQIAALFVSTRELAAALLPMVVFLANTGCRKGEAIACEWSWIDLEHDMIRIPVTEFWRPKSGRAREVPISPSLRRLLDIPAASRAHERWVHPSRSGDRYVCFPDELFRAVRRGAGLVGGPHTLRHSFASAFLAARPDMFLLAQVLGHAHTRVTELYSHLLPSHLERARGAVDIGAEEG